MTGRTGTDAVPAAGVTVVRGGHLLTMGPAGDIADGAVALEDSDEGLGTILAVGPATEVLAAYPGAPVVGGPNDIVVPGFVNGHDHLSESLISGLAETMNLYEWQQKLIAPVVCRLDREMARVGARLKGVEMLQSGITCVNDMFVHTNPGSRATLGVVDGLEEIGLRGVVSYGAFDDPGGLTASPLDEIMAEHEALAARTAETADRVRFRLGVGTIHGQSDTLFRASIAAAADHGWAVHTHLAEVREEITDARIRWGTNTVGRAEAFGLVGIDTVYAHCVWVTEPDISRLTRGDAAGHAAVVHNPVSNMILASGVCPVPRLRAAGIPVGLGTDGSASNDSHDMLQVMKFAALLQKLTFLEPNAMTARDALTMATIDGARALRMDDVVGSLEVGKRGDLVRVAGQGPRLAYIHDPYQALVHCAGTGDVADVWIGGRRVLADRRTVLVDEAAVVDDARRLAAELVEAAGIHDLLGSTSLELLKRSPSPA